MASEAKADGYYLGSDGARYAKLIASPWGSENKFSIGDNITEGKVYYFKVEPIKWRILEEGDEEAFILAELILDNRRYNESYLNARNGVYANNYKESEIRAWLNNEFYDTAFNDLQKQIILTTEVDNSLASTGDSRNPYVCANTNDKIFLLSVAEARNVGYRFAINDSLNTGRGRLTSDYSRSKGACILNEAGSQYGNGAWWLRSPGYYISNLARHVGDDGYIYDYHVYDPYSGVVPALRIRLS